MGRETNPTHLIFGFLFGSVPLLQLCVFFVATLFVALGFVRLVLLLLHGPPI